MSYGGDRQIGLIEALALWNQLASQKAEWLYKLQQAREKLAESVSTRPGEGGFSIYPRDELRMIQHTLGLGLTGEDHVLPTRDINAALEWLQEMEKHKTYVPVERIPEWGVEIQFLRLKLLIFSSKEKVYAPERLLGDADRGLLPTTQSSKLLTEAQEASTPP